MEDRLFWAGSRNNRTGHRSKNTPFDSSPNEGEGDDDDVAEAVGHYLYVPPVTGIG